MKSPRSFLAAAAFVLLTAAHAADISGKWTWPMPGREGTTEAVGVFAVRDGKLSGTVSGRMGEAPIGDASLSGDKVAFTVTREVRGAKIAIKYAGVLAGDAITGTIERPPANEHDAPVILEWKAVRQP